MNKRSIITFSFFLVFYALFSQIKGVIVDEDDNPIEFVTVAVYSLPDSLLITGTITDSLGRYSININNENFENIFLTISKIGLESVYLKPVSNQIIKLYQKNIDLQDVIVTAYLPYITNNNGNLLVNINNTFLSNAISTNEIFSYLPGVVVNTNGDLSIFDRDNLVVYINDIIVRSQEQIKSIQPADIDKIEIIRNPGAEYSSSIDAVIRIWTKRNLSSENYILTLTNNLLLGRKISNNHNFSVLLNKEKLSILGTYYFNNSNIKQFDLSEAYNFFESTTIENVRELVVEHKFRNNNIFLALNYEIDKSHLLGFQYTSTISNWKMYPNGMQYIYIDDNLNKIVNFENYENHKQEMHNFNFNYIRSFNKDHKFTFITDYAFPNTKIINYIKEHNNNDEKLKIQENLSNAFYQIFSLNPEHNFSNNNINWINGIKFAYMSSSSKITYFPSLSDLQDDYKINEKLGSLYSNLGLKINNLSITLGVRGEMLFQTMVKDNASLVDNSSKNIFPYISVRKSLKNNLEFSMTYRQFISRPSFSDLNPTYIYRDSLTYVAGNPLLKPMKANLFSLNISKNNFLASISYRIYHDSFILEDKRDVNNPNIMISSLGNLSEKNSLLSVNLGYNYNSPRLKSTTNFNVNKPYTKVYFNSDTLTLSKPIFNIKTVLNFNLTEMSTIYFSFNVTSAGNTKNMNYDSFSNLEIGFNHFMLNKKMLVSLYCYDIFHTNQSNRWTSYNNNIKYSMNSNSDSRKLALSIRFNLGKNEKTIEKKSSNTESINRL